MSMPVYNVTSKFSAECLVKLWPRRKQVQRRMDDQKEGKVLREGTKRFWLILLSEKMAQQEHNHSM